jgi:hypothetical protein
MIRLLAAAFDVPLRIAEAIAKDAQENLDGLDVVSIGPMWSTEVDGQRQHHS